MGYETRVSQAVSLVESSREPLATGDETQTKSMRGFEHYESWNCQLSDRPFQKIRQITGCNVHAFASDMSVGSRGLTQPDDGYGSER